MSFSLFDNLLKSRFLYHFTHNISAASITYFFSSFSSSISSCSSFILIRTHSPHALPPPFPCSILSFPQKVDFLERFFTRVSFIQRNIFPFFSPPVAVFSFFFCHSMAAAVPYSRLHQLISAKKTCCDIPDGDGGDHKLLSWLPPTSLYTHAHIHTHTDRHRHTETHTHPSRRGM